MRIIEAGSGERLRIGHQGEHGAAAVRFDLTAWQNLYGNGSVRLLVQRAGDEVPYDRTVTVRENAADWEIGAADTEKAGWGACELSYYVDKTLVKSAVWGFYVAESLGSVTMPEPNPWMSIVDTVQSYAAEAEQQRIAAEQASELAMQQAASGGFMKVYLDGEGHLHFVRTANMEQVRFEINQEGRLMAHVG